MSDTPIYPVLKTEDDRQLLRSKRLPPREPGVVEGRLIAIEEAIRRLDRTFAALVGAHAELQTAFLEEGRQRERDEPRLLPTVWPQGSGS